MKLTLISGIFTMHGLFIASAVVIMILISVIYCKSREYDETLLLRIAPFAILFGFIGARLLYVSLCDSLYLEAVDKWKLLDGGYAIFGTFYAVALTVVIYCAIAKKKEQMLGAFDALSFAAPVAIAIGRMGSVFTEDCLGESVEPENLRFFPVALYSNTYGEYQYAVFFYEAVYCIISFVIIAYVCKNIKRTGAATYMFTVLYCGGRSFFESLRSDSIYFTFVRVSQVLAVLTLIGVFIAMCIKLAKKTGFKWKYLINYGVFSGAFALAFVSEFFMGSHSRFANTLKVFICCIIMVCTAVYTGYEYIASKKKRPEKDKQNGAVQRKRTKKAAKANR